MSKIICKFCTRNLDQSHFKKVQQIKPNPNCMKCISFQDKIKNKDVADNSIMPLWRVVYHDDKYHLAISVAEDTTDHTNPKECVILIQDANTTSELVQTPISISAQFVHSYEQYRGLYEQQCRIDTLQQQNDDLIKQSQIPPKTNTGIIDSQQQILNFSNTDIADTPKTNPNPQSENSVKFDLNPTFITDQISKNDDITNTSDAKSDTPVQPDNHPNKTTAYQKLQKELQKQYNTNPPKTAELDLTKQLLEETRLSDIQFKHRFPLSFNISLRLVLVYNNLYTNTNNLL
eukprot:84079_1